MTAVPRDTVLVDGRDALLRALHAADEGDTILLAPAIIDLDRPIVLARRVELAAAAAERPLLRFLSPEAGIRLQRGGDGSRLAGFDVVGRGHREAPLLRIEEADDVTIADVGLGRTEGSGFAARGARRLAMERVFISDTGIAAGEVRDCADLSLDLILTMIARRARAAGIALANVSGAIALTARDVAGSAVALSHPQTGPLRLQIHASECQRALSVMGDGEAPVTGLTADVLAEDMEEWGALLSNVSGAMLTLQSRRCDPLRLDGRAGARDCTIALATDRPERLSKAGRSGDNGIAMVPALPFPPMRSTPAAAAFAPRFPARTVVERCTVCGEEARFRRTTEQFRETFACPHCRAALRYRAQAQALLKVLSAGRHPSLRALAEAGDLKGLAIFEPGLVGPLRPFLKTAGFYKASVYEPGRNSGEVIDGTECQDLTATSFAEATFDLVVTSDILEHVRRPEEAWREIRRILKPGGHHVFSIPLTTEMPDQSIARVDTSGPEDRLLLPPVYHGDGAGGLSLVYTDFGADILDALAAAGLPSRFLPYESADTLCATAITVVSERPA